MCATLQYQVNYIGHCAYDALCQKCTATVLGCTSKGVFLLNDKKRVLFISNEKFCGPLTINLSTELALQDHVSVGEEVELGESRVDLSQLTIWIEKSVHIWKPFPIKLPQNGLPKAKERGGILAEKFIDSHSGTPFNEFIRAIGEGFADSTASAAKRAEELWELIPSGGEGIKDISEKLLGLIGFGQGLTPAGDDFLCGYLLAQHYFAQGLPYKFSQQKLNKKIIAMAFSQTTSLSTNLIQCAARGSADERLLDCLRWMVEGGVCLAEIKEELLSYGSSSGVDAFAGMLAAIFLQ